MCVMWSQILKKLSSDQGHGTQTLYSPLPIKIAKCFPHQMSKMIHNGKWIYFSILTSAIVDRPFSDWHLSPYWQSPQPLQDVLPPELSWIIVSINIRVSNPCFNIFYLPVTDSVIYEFKIDVNTVVNHVRVCLLLKNRLNWRLHQVLA